MCTCESWRSTKGWLYVYIATGVTNCWRGRNGNLQSRLRTYRYTTVDVYFPYPAWKQHSYMYTYSYRYLVYFKAIVARIYSPFVKIGIRTAMLGTWRHLIARFHTVCLCNLNCQFAPCSINVGLNYISVTSYLRRVLDLLKELNSRMTIYDNIVYIL